MKTRIGYERFKMVSLKQTNSHVNFSWTFIFNKHQNFILVNFENNSRKYTENEVKVVSKGKIVGCLY